MLGARRGACLLLIIFTSVRVNFLPFISLTPLTCPYFTRRIDYVNAAIKILIYRLPPAIMSSITFTRQSGCNYDDTSTTNPALSGMVKVREAIGLKDKSKWDKEWRPIFINFIESSNMIAIDLTKEKAKSKQELLTKIWEFINLVRDDAASDVPDGFFETALFVLFSLLRAQVRSQVKEAPKEEKFRLTSTTPAPARPTPGSASTSEAKISPLTGQTTIMLRRTNQSGFISSLFACWSHLAVFPPPSPPTETLPDVTTGEISVLHQLLKHFKIWNDKESIYWIDPNGNPFELRGDLDFRMMVYAAYTMQEPTRAREIRVKGADTEPVLCMLLVVHCLSLTLTFYFQGHGQMKPRVAICLCVTQQK